MTRLTLISTRCESFSRRNLRVSYPEQIAARPRPYNSHANDAVRAMILERVRNVTAGHEFAHIGNDLISNVSFVYANKEGVYFEGTNILVKIDGTNAEYLNQGGVLFSAHYDSVSTAPGVTDDGMAVVSLIQMIQYLIGRRPERTAVFNINNGEEDGLHGAHAYVDNERRRERYADNLSRFLQHPWSKITDTFLNLEGAAAGG